RKTCSTRPGAWSRSHACPARPWWPTPRWWSRFRATRSTWLAKGSTDMKWTEVQEIAIQLADTHPEVDPTKVNFVDLMNWVMALPDFDDDPKRCGERILEGIQQAWIDEV